MELNFEEDLYYNGFEEENISFIMELSKKFNIDKSTVKKVIEKECYDDTIRLNIEKELGLEKASNPENFDDGETICESDIDKYNHFKTNLYAKSLQKWGFNSQINMLFEELGELIVAINKSHRKINCYAMEKVINEIADVEIMLEQYCYIAMISREHIDKKKKEKLLRLESYLEGKNEQS